MPSDVASGQNGCAPLLLRERRPLGEVMTAMRGVAPFPLLGLDTDDDTVLVDATVKARAARRRASRSRARGPAAGTTGPTSSRKSGAVVRPMVGCRRLGGSAAAGAPARLHRPMRLFAFFQPSFELVEKRREGARVRKRHDPPRTPHQRLVADPRAPQAPKDARHAGLDPVRLPGETRAAQRALVEIADERPAAGGRRVGGRRRTHPRGLPRRPGPGPAPGPGLAWPEGEVRPTARPKATKPRHRTVPDPLEAVTADLEAWFDPDPGGAD